MAKIDIEVLEKRGFASRLYNFNFASQMGDDETISSVAELSSIPTSNTAVPLTVGAPAIGAKAVQFRLSGGSHNGKYLQICKVLTSAGNQLQAEGYLLVREVAGAPVNYAITPGSGNVVFTAIGAVIS